MLYGIYATGDIEGMFFLFSVTNLALLQAHAFISIHCPCNFNTNLLLLNLAFSQQYPCLPCNYLLLHLLALQYTKKIATMQQPESPNSFFACCANPAVK
jgi:hypothetical protein